MLLRKSPMSTYLMLMYFIHFYFSTEAMECALEIPQCRRYRSLDDCCPLFMRCCCCYCCLCHVLKESETCATTCCINFIILCHFCTTIIIINMIVVKKKTIIRQWWEKRNFFVHWIKTRNERNKLSYLIYYRNGWCEESH